MKKKVETFLSTRKTFVIPVSSHFLHTWRTRGEKKSKRALKEREKKKEKKQQTSEANPACGGLIPREGIDGECRRERRLRGGGFTIHRGGM